MRSTQTHPLKSILTELLYFVPISLISTHLMVGSTLEGNYLEIFLQEGYLLRIIPKTFLALLLILLTRRITRYLDVKAPWHEGKWSRLFLQICYGILGVVLFDFLISALYLTLKGISISDTHYFGFYLPLICIYVVLVNSWYLYQHLIANKEISIAQKKAEPAEKESLEKSQLEEIRDYSLKIGVVYIARNNKFAIAKNIQGEYIAWNNSIHYSSMALSETDFFMVGRPRIIHRSIIADFEEQPEVHKLSIILKPPFNDVIPVPLSRHMAFKKWWNQD